MLLKKDLKNKKNQLLVNAQVSVEFLERKKERAFKKQNLDYIRYRKVTEELDCQQKSAIQENILQEAKSKLKY